MITKRLDDLTKDDIEALVENKVEELRTLEYKESLPGNTDADRKEFLADASSFANAGGGHLLYGLVAERDGDNKPTGAPESAPGVEVANADAEKLRLDNLIRDGIAPRLPGVGIKFIDGFVSGFVAIIHVPSSFAAPHMVTFRGTSRFYSRNSAGKYPLDVTEIRSAFNASESVRDAMHRFRQERLARIVASETPVPLANGAAIVLHLYPLSAARPGHGIDVVGSTDMSHRLRPIWSGSGTGRFNFDGYVVASGGSPSGPREGYVQVFRTGAIEAVDVGVLSADGKETPTIPSTLLERVVIDSTGSYLRVMQELGVDFPAAVFLTLAGVRGYQLAAPCRVFHLTFLPMAIDRDTLPLPEVLVEDDGVEAARALRPAFDVMWQAAGWARSMNYDESGAWIGER